MGGRDPSATSEVGPPADFDVQPRKPPPLIPASLLGNDEQWMRRAGGRAGMIRWNGKGDVAHLNAIIRLQFGTLAIEAQHIESSLIQRTNCGREGVGEPAELAKTRIFLKHGMVVTRRRVGRPTTRDRSCRRHRPIRGGDEALC